MRSTLPQWVPERTGVKNGNAWIMKAHAEALVSVYAGDFLVSATVEYPGIAEALVSTLPRYLEGDDIDAPITRFGQIERGGLASCQIGYVPSAR